jgi:hypothetical protein
MPYHYVATPSREHDRPTIYVYEMYNAANNFRHVAYETTQERDGAFARLDTQEAVDRYAEVVAGLVPLGPAPVETFLDFGDCAFDARDIIAVNKYDANLREIVAGSGGDEYCRVYFRVAPDKPYGVPFDSPEARDAGYRRIVAAMKASRA